MSVLTKEEISQIYCDRPTWDGFARAIEAAVLEKLKQQEPVAWMVRNGVVDHQLFWSKQQADALCAEMQKRHDLSGSHARFSVAPLHAAPVPAAVHAKEHDQQDVRCECCGYMTHHREHLGCIRAAKPAAVPDGWKLVPIEPTEDMLWALYGFLVGQLSEPDYKRYRAMLSASPAAPAVPDDVAKQRDELVRLCEFNEKTMGDLIKQRDGLLAALEKMNRAYVILLESGRDRIRDLGGECDGIDVMERNDPNLRESRAAIAAVRGAA